MNPYARSVFWYSGQFLDPQHFQQTDRYHQSQLGAASSISRPYPWGAGVVEVDEAALALGILKVTRADLLFQDGTRAAVEPIRGDGNAVIETLELQGLWKTCRESVTVYVGLSKPAAKGDVAGLTAESAAATGRYLAAETDELLADRYALPHPSLSDSGVPVRTLYYYLRLFTRKESGDHGDRGDRYDRSELYSFPLIRLQNGGCGFKCDPNWCPPLIRLSASPAILRTAAVFETRLAVLVKRLAPMRPTNIYAPANAALLTLLSNASATLADLRFLLTCPNAQVHELFNLLRRGLAAMSGAVQSDRDMAALAGTFRFQHNAPMESLALLMPWYRRLFNMVLPEIIMELPFTVRGDLLVTALPEADPSYGEPLLMLKTHAPVSKLLEERRLLAGSPADVQEAILRAAPALPLTLVNPPSGLPNGPCWAYLKPDIRSAAWEHAFREGELAVAFLGYRFESDLAAESRVIFIKGKE
jgi:type VI secretion system protein ImpJ